MPGNQATRGFSPALAVALTIPNGLARACCYDDVSGTWVGPRYEATGNPNRGGTSEVDWVVTFDRGSRASMAALARRAVWRQGNTVSARKLVVSHVVAGKRVGTLAAYGLIQSEPAPSARHFAVVVVSLSRGLRAVVTFDLSAPFSDSAGSDGSFVIEGMPPSRWNLLRSQTAIRSVAIEGDLPPAHVSATGSRGHVVGRVSDQFHDPVSEIPVKLMRRAGAGWRIVGRGTTISSGRYDFLAPGKGSYRVVATLSGSSKSSRTVRVS